MNAHEERTCPPPDILATLIDGRLTPEHRTEVLCHVSRCAQCRYVIEAVVDTEEAEAGPAADIIPLVKKPERRTRLWAIAAAILIGVVGAILAIRLAIRRPDPIAQLAASMPDSARTIEPRLTGGFRWAPLQDVRRSPESPSTPEDLVAGAAAGATLRQVDNSRDSSALHAAGIAYLFLGQTKRAADTLGELTQKEPDDAKAWSDLSAALYIDGVSRNDRARLNSALAAANRAIALEGDLTQAYFNRAVILERIGDEGGAQGAWNSYLAQDSTSAWAAEARDRLKNLSRTRRKAPL